MKLADVVTVAASRATVWTFLADARKLGSCLHGLEAVDIAETGDAFSGSVVLNMGSRSLRFPIRVEWVKQNPELGGRLRAVALVGGYKLTGGGTITLTDNLQGTDIAWQIDVLLPPELQENQILVQLAQNFAATIMRNFFTCLREHLQDVGSG